MQREDDTEKENAVDWKLIIVAGIGALGALWFNVLFARAVALFLVKAFAIFWLACGGWYSALLICRPRRIMTDAHITNKTTWQEFMAEAYHHNPFMQDLRASGSLTEEKGATSWDLRKGFLGESSASLTWLFTIIFLTLTASYIPLSLIAILAIIPLGVNWIKYLLLYDRWPRLSQQMAQTEHYGLWLLERIQYGLILLYCVDFACYNAGLL